jgi:aspartate dehydrogenase
VTHVVRKPPRGLLAPDEAAASSAAGQPRELYSGPAREAALRFPENVNVAAAISLAGLGLDKTTVRVVADPTVERNTHEIEARGEFGDLRIVLRNIPYREPEDRPPDRDEHDQGIAQLDRAGGSRNVGAAESP